MLEWVDTIFRADYPTSLAKIWPSADVAQLAEHLICNQAVASSSLAVSSPVGTHEEVFCVVERQRGGVLKWPTRADCKSAGASLRRFESFPHHWGGLKQGAKIRGSSSVGRAQAFQA